MQGRSRCPRVLDLRLAWHRSHRDADGDAEEEDCLKIFQTDPEAPSPSSGMGFSLLMGWVVRYGITTEGGWGGTSGGVRVCDLRETLLCITAVRSSVQFHLPESRQDPR